MRLHMRNNPLPPEPHGPVKGDSNLLLLLLLAVDADDIPQAGVEVGGDEQNQQQLEDLQRRVRDRDVENSCVQYRNHASQPDISIPSHSSIPRAYVLLANER